MTRLHERYVVMIGQWWQGYATLSLQKVLNSSSDDLLAAMGLPTVLTHFFSSYCIMQGNTILSPDIIFCVNSRILAVTCTSFSRCYWTKRPLVPNRHLNWSLMLALCQILALNHLLAWSKMLIPNHLLAWNQVLFPSHLLVWSQMLSPSHLSTAVNNKVASAQCFWW